MSDDVIAARLLGAAQLLVEQARSSGRKLTGYAISTAYADRGIGGASGGETELLLGAVYQTAHRLHARLDGELTVASPRVELEPAKEPIPPARAKKKS